MVMCLNRNPSPLSVASGAATACAGWISSFRTRAYRRAVNSARGISGDSAAMSLSWNCSPTIAASSITVRSRSSNRSSLASSSAWIVGGADSSVRSLVPIQQRGLRPLEILDEDDDRLPAGQNFEHASQRPGGVAGQVLGRLPTDSEQLADLRQRLAVAILPRHQPREIG